jgi:hypothetical protein
VEKIKSAWEIAMERAAGRSSVKPEELRKQNEEKGRIIGKALADKFLIGWDKKKLKADLEKYGEEERPFIIKGTRTALIESLVLGDYEKLENIIEGLSSLAGSSRLSEIKGSLLLVYDSYTRVYKKSSEKFQAEGGKILNRYGISGDAVKAINPSVFNEELKKINRDDLLPLEKEYEKLKKDLLNLS